MKVLLEKQPTSKEIKEYLQRSQVLGNQHIQDVSLLGGGNHYNYRADTIDGSFVIRVSHPRALGVGALFDIPDEYTLLRLIEEYRVGPRAVAVDLEGFHVPVLIEEYIDGTPYNEVNELDEHMCRQALELCVRVSHIRLHPETFPFRFSYTRYETNIKGWHSKLIEINEIAGQDKLIKESLKSFQKIATRAASLLEQHQPLLDETSHHFIYNDVHGGNLYWRKENESPMFIDWQKVSLGDPAFMPALFARRFADKAHKPAEEFRRWVLDNYSLAKDIRHFEELYRLRILEREVADMIWVVWAKLKEGGELPYKEVGGYERLLKADQLLKDFAK